MSHVIDNKVEVEVEGKGDSLVHQESGTEGTKARLGEEYVVVQEEKGKGEKAGTQRV